MLLCIIVLAGSLGSVYAAPLDVARAPRQEDLQLLQLWIDDEAASDELLTAYQRGDRWLIPFATLARLLDLAIEAQPERGLARGFVLSEERSFFLDVGRGEVTRAGVVGRFRRDQVELQRDDIYVDLRLAALWLPVDLHVDLSQSRLVASAREPLPRQLRAERERRRAGLAAPAPARPVYPVQANPPRLATLPSIDQTFTLGARRHGDGRIENEAGYTTYATADLFGLESVWFLAGRDQDNLTDFRATLGRRDPEAGLLGPLHAREFAFGDINDPGMPLVSRIQPPSAGLLVSSYPLQLQTQFDRHTFQGDLLPGWEVELYHNGALLDIQRPDAASQYRFEEVPLFVGMNHFRLVFYGPQGQRREEEHRFLLGATLTPPGAHYYRLSVQRDDAGEARTLLQTDVGLGRHLSLAAGYARLPLEGSAGAARQYGRLGLRSFWSRWFVHGDVVTDDRDGAAAQVGVQTRVGGVGLGVTHTRLDGGFASEDFPALADPLRSRTRLNLDTAIPLGFGARLPTAIEAVQERFVSEATRTEIRQRLSAFGYGVAVTNQLRWEQRSDEAQALAEGTLQLTRRFGRYRARGEFFYALEPESEERALDLLLERAIGDGYLLRLGFNHLYANERDRYSIGVNKSAGRFALGLEAGYASDGERTLALTLFAGLGHEPRTTRWHASARPAAAYGAVSAAAFLDGNGNGIKDPAEAPLAGVGFTVNGIPHAARTDATGIAYLDGLAPYQHVDVALALETLEDPAWVSVRRGTRLLVRPGPAAGVDFPVTVTSEIEGHAFVAEGKRRRQLAGVEVELLDAQDRVVQKTLSGYDGYFYFSAVPAGAYRVRPALIDSIKLGLAPATRRFDVAGEGGVQSLELLARKETAVSTRPALADARATPPPPGVSGKPRAPLVYTVKEGDWLWELSRRFYGTTEHAHRILAANRDRIADPNVLVPGQELVIPPPADVAARPAPREPFIYTVQAGDWLWQLSRRFYGNTHEVHRIIQANRDSIGDPDRLVPGQQLVIPPRTGFVDVREGEWTWEVVRRHPLARTPFRHFE